MKTQVHTPETITRLQREATLSTQRAGLLAVNVGLNVYALALMAAGIVHRFF